MTRFRYVFAMLLGIAAVAMIVMTGEESQPTEPLAFATPETILPRFRRSTTTATAPMTAARTTTAPPTTVAPTAPPTTVAAATTPPTTAPPTTAPPTTTVPAQGNEIAQANAHSLALLNQLRGNLGLNSLTVGPQMSAFALDWSREMSATDFRHSSGPWAENIVSYSNDGLTPQQAAASLHDSWVNSLGHYANMTNSRWDFVGIGLYRDADGWWGTHVFR